MLKLRTFICSLICIFYVSANPAYAIPSPELIIGSVSSIGQVLAVVFAVVSGGLATLGAKLGMKPRPDGAQNAIYGKVAFILGICVLGLLALNFWQYSKAKTALQMRLQATLVRPAQFSGTEIQDNTLKETSFAAQSSSQMSVTTAEANALLDQSVHDPDILFMDIRETAEREMGGLINSSHQRFPDIQQSLPQFIGKQVILYCHNGNRSSETCENLRAMGIDCRFVAGGLEKWIVEGRPFSDSQVRGLSDLRAIPEYENKDVLLDTAAFKQAAAVGDLQIIDTRYPGDFALGHLPNAINIPLRALPTQSLEAKMNALENKPTIVACYDRRSCFMGQVLGWELAKKGINFQGRYTTPWEYFIPPTPKPHVLDWQAAQSVTYWQTAIMALASVITKLSAQTHIIFAIFSVSLISRILVLPIAIKSERDQIITHAKSDDLAKLKTRLSGDPVRKARAIKAFYVENGLTPMRNMTALLFLPVMMLGLSSVEMVSKTVTNGFLWVNNLGVADPTFGLPVLFTLLACLYLNFAIAKTIKQRILMTVIGLPLLLFLTFQLTAAGNIYLCFSLILLLVQRAYLAGFVEKIGTVAKEKWQNGVIKTMHSGIIPLDQPHALFAAGNKAFRLSIMRNAGIPVPNGVVLTADFISKFDACNPTLRARLTEKIWTMSGKAPCAVRSSAAAEDGEDQSFAGVFESILNVEHSGLEAAINDVTASFKSARSRQYGAMNDENHDGNIVIQSMVPALYSGVLFTQDPQAPGQTLIELANGTADDLVSGRITPLTSRFGRFTKVQIDETLNPMDLRPLLQLGDEIEKLFGCPQDIEWAYSQNGFEIVQSRDITTLNMGSQTELLRRQQWQDIFAICDTSDPDAIILEQDEMSEVLPRPTPLSFSIMKSIWGAGGSVDCATRNLGFVSHQPEERPGHLVRFFGKLYSDPKAKHEHALIVSPSSRKRVTREISKVFIEFEETFLPSLERSDAYYKAIDFNSLPADLLVHEIGSLHEKFVTQTYLFAEKVNILAGIAMSNALAYCAENDLDSAHLLQGHIEHSPVNLLARKSDEPDAARREYLLEMMGHRSVFDYEIADQRYNETPDLLLEIAKSHSEIKDLSCQTSDVEVIKNALLLQDLKENAKNQSLKIFAHLRRAILAFSKQKELGVSVFYLTINEIMGSEGKEGCNCADIAFDRQNSDLKLRNMAPQNTQISLHQAEILSSVNGRLGHVDCGALSGTRVSGEGELSGRCYVVSKDVQESGKKLDGFEAGDILVCQMVHPSWLSEVVIAGAVLSEIGGWLSHMAIVAREKDVNMFVGCTGLEALQHGDVLNVSDEGVLSVNEAEYGHKLKA